jgi:hypothetical protein
VVTISFAIILFTFWTFSRVLMLPSHILSGILNPYTAVKDYVFAVCDLILLATSLTSMRTYREGSSFTKKFFPPFSVLRLSVLCMTPQIWLSLVIMFLMPLLLEHETWQPRKWNNFLTYLTSIMTYTS